MEFVYVVTINEVNDCESAVHLPNVFKNEKDALQFLKESYDDAKEDYKQYHTDMIYDFYVTSAEIYKCNDWTNTHWEIVMYKVPLH